MTNPWEKLKTQGEIASEQGRQDKALFYLDQALIMALKKKNYSEAINILGHHLHVYKVLYQETLDKSFMELFYSNVLAGLGLAEKNNISGQAKSVMLLRAGDYHLVLNEYQTAAKQYELAVKELQKSSGQAAETKAEYIGHWAFALAKTGTLKRAFAKFGQAFQLLKTNHQLRPFHRLIVESGLLLRRAETYANIKEKALAKKDLQQAKIIATRLVKEFKMKEREDQVKELEKRL